jgi:hypothetical protein
VGVIVAVISLALVGALLANRFLRPLVFPDQEDKDGASVADLVAPVQLLAALFLAFVLAQSSQSYARARTAALNEAEVVDAAFETGDYLPEPQREAVQGALVCYTRAVIGPEWRTMQQGQQSPVPSIWTGVQIRRSQDAERAGGRQELILFDPPLGRREPVQGAHREAGRGQSNHTAGGCGAGAASDRAIDRRVRVEDSPGG